MSMSLAFSLAMTARRNPPAMTTLLGCSNTSLKTSCGTCRKHQVRSYCVSSCILALHRFFVIRFHHRLNPIPKPAIVGFFASKRQSEYPRQCIPCCHALHTVCKLRAQFSVGLDYLRVILTHVHDCALKHSANVVVDPAPLAFYISLRLECPFLKVCGSPVQEVRDSRTRAQCFPHVLCRSEGYQSVET